MTLSFPLLFFSRDLEVGTGVASVCVQRGTLVRCVMCAHLHTTRTGMSAKVSHCGCTELCCIVLIALLAALVLYCTYCSAGCTRVCCIVLIALLAALGCAVLYLLHCWLH